jgi:uncharacterized membrane protein YphA (DoxX/SURF4 family)
MTGAVLGGSDGAGVCDDRSRDHRLFTDLSNGCDMTRAGLVQTVLSTPDRMVRCDRTLTRVAVVSGLIFIIAGLVKFVFHHWELHAFDSFGLPWPAALEIFAGVVETLSGVLLVARRWVVPAAILLSATMIVAVGSSGIAHGEVIPSLTLAPALLLAMLYLLVRTLAPWSVRRVADEQRAV